jgi:predicted DNA-binding protein YlxM (UPF0122 family)
MDQYKVIDMEFKDFQSKINGPLTKEGAAIILKLKFDENKTWTELAEMFQVSRSFLNDAVNHCEDKYITFNVSTPRAMKLFEDLKKWKNL